MCRDLAAAPQAPWAAPAGSWDTRGPGSGTGAPGRNLALKSNYICRLSSSVLAAVDACAAFAL